MELQTLTQKFKQLQAARPLPPAVLANLAEWLKVEITYASNALEGNTLTRAETSLVLGKGITVSGKPLKDHLEATDHAAAWEWVLKQSRRNPQSITESDILNLHQWVLQSSERAWAGRYRQHSVRVAGAAVVFPNPAKVPHLMTQLQQWLRHSAQMHPVLLAAEAHYRLVTIHPFADGNGRTARLLMNMILLQSGYPPAIIAPSQRANYLTCLEQAQTGGAYEPFEQLILKSANAGLDLYLSALSQTPTQAAAAPVRHRNLLRMGQLSNITGVSIPTLRHWIHVGLIAPASRTESGYQLFAQGAVAAIKTIRTLQDQKLTLAEILDKVSHDSLPIQG